MHVTGRTKHPTRGVPRNSDMCEYFRQILLPQLADALPTQAEWSHPDSWRPCDWMHVVWVCVGPFPEAAKCVCCATLMLHHRYKHRTTFLPGASWLGKEQRTLCIYGIQEQWALHPPDCLQENSGKDLNNFLGIYLYIYISVYEILISTMKKVCSKIYNNVLHTAL